jgi:hypothetical protein
VLKEDTVRGGLRQGRRDVVGLRGFAPLVLDPPHIETVGIGDPRETVPEVASDRNHDSIVRGEQVGDRRFEPTGPGGGEHEDIFLGVEQGFQTDGDLSKEGAVPGSAMIDKRAALSQ